MTQVESRCTQKTASSLSVEVGDRRTPSLTDRRVLVGEVSRTSSSSSYEHRGTTHVTHRESGGGRGRERERERDSAELLVAQPRAATPLVVYYFSDGGHTGNKTVQARREIAGLDGVLHTASLFHRTGRRFGRSASWCRCLVTTVKLAASGRTIDRVLRRASDRRGRLMPCPSSGE